MGSAGPSSFRENKFTPTGCIKGHLATFSSSDPDKPFPPPPSPSSFPPSSFSSPLSSYYIFFFKPRVFEEKELIIKFNGKQDDVFVNYNYHFLLYLCKIHRYY